MGLKELGLRQLEWDGGNSETDPPFGSANAAINRHNREIEVAYLKGVEDGKVDYWIKGWVPAEHKTSFVREVRSNPALGAPYGQEPSIRSCNRHSNCEQANKDWLNNHAMEKYVPMNFHCHNDECEDCFGC